MDVKGFDAYQHWFWRQTEQFGPLTTGCGRLRGDTPLVVIALEGNVAIPFKHDSSVIGCDVYNGQLTGDKSVTLTANSCVSANHAGPSVIVLNDQGWV